jgi:serine/threonine protein kinase
MESNNSIIFLNKDALKVDDLFLHEEWELEPLFPNIYSISNFNWIVKIYKSIKYAKRESDNLNRLKKIQGIPQVLAISLSHHFSYIIMSKAPGLDLFEYTNKHGFFSESSIKPIAKQLLTIINNVHRHNIIHKDIKPENIIYDPISQQITLIDFEGKCTEDYRSPEQILKSPLSFKTDIWSIGATLYYLFHAKLPFNTKNDILKNEPRYSTKLTPHFTEFLKCLMCKNTKNRYNSQNCLNHKWIF